MISGTTWIAVYARQFKDGEWDFTNVVRNDVIAWDYDRVIMKSEEYPFEEDVQLKIFGFVSDDNHTGPGRAGLIRADLVTYELALRDEDDTHMTSELVFFGYDRRYNGVSTSSA